jgi:transposase
MAHHAVNIFTSPARSHRRGKIGQGISSNPALVERLRSCSRPLLLAVAMDMTPRRPAIDWRLYKERHQVECIFNKLKHFRRIALRCEKTITAFMGFVHLACAMIWLK